VTNSLTMIQQLETYIFNDFTNKCIKNIIPNMFIKTNYYAIFLAKDSDSSTFKNIKLFLGNEFVNSNVRISESLIQINNFKLELIQTNNFKQELVNVNDKNIDLIIIDEAEQELSTSENVLSKLDTCDIKLKHIKLYMAFQQRLDSKDYELPKHLLHTATTEISEWKILKSKNIIVLYKDDKKVSIELDIKRRPIEGVDYIIYPVINYPFDETIEYILLDFKKEIKDDTG